MLTSLNAGRWSQRVYPRKVLQSFQGAKQEEPKAIVPTGGRNLGELAAHEVWMRIWCVAALALIVNRLSTPSKEKLGTVQQALPQGSPSPFTSRRSRSNRKVQFQDGFERVKMPDGEKIQLNRQAYNNMRVAQHQLRKLMNCLCESDLDNKYYEQSPIFQALKAYVEMRTQEEPEQEKAPPDQLYLDEIGRQLRESNSRQMKTPEQFKEMLSDFKKSLGCIDKHLANAQKGKWSWSKLTWEPLDSPNPHVEAARACLQDYRAAMEQLVVKT